MLSFHRSLKHAEPVPTLDPTWQSEDGAARLYCGDCLDVLPMLADGSVDAVITDPPYPEISRDYGRMTEAEWHAMMDRVVPECRRILKPTGSAVFILQPNSERVGRMRPWLWEFMAKWTREWGMVQDVWWWNFTAVPVTHCSRRFGLTRPSVKACVWLGGEYCYRNQDGVLWSQSEANAAANRADRALKYGPSGVSSRRGRCYEAADERGGSTPFNLVPISNRGIPSGGSNHGHGAATPNELADWWLRYICPPGGTVLDPFIGSGTMGIAAVKRGCSIIGVERMEKYHDVASGRIECAIRERSEQLIA